MSVLSRARARERALVELAFANGANIEERYRCVIGDIWHRVDEPDWDWNHAEFRVMGDVSEKAAKMMPGIVTRNER